MQNPMSLFGIQQPGNLYQQQQPIIPVQGVPGRNMPTQATAVHPIPGLVHVYPGQDGKGA